MRDDNIDGITNHLPRILFEQGISILELAERTGIPYGSLYPIVNGQTKGIKFDRLALICTTLGVDVGDVYTVTHPSPESD